MIILILIQILILREEINLFFKNYCLLFTTALVIVFDEQSEFRNTKK